MRKRIVIVILSVFILSGCRYMNEDRSFTKEEIEESILTHMEDKYGEKFTIENIGYSAPLGNDVEAFVISEEDERKNEIQVNWRYEDGKELIDDNYTHLLYKKETNELMDPLIEDGFKEFEYAAYSRVSDDVPIEKYDKNIPFKKIAKAKKVGIEVAILLNENAVNEEEKIKEKILQLYEDVKSKTTDEVHFSINVYICGNSNFYENQPLMQQFKELYSLDIDDASLTYYEPYKEVLTEFWFTSNDIEGGVDVR
ncbi:MULTISPECIES: hypothetical protein [unclassified Breznakia]|uniref:hypothetical protein n=1 Tax=unclassified Breznakia TaxID=2623764 RepID=UPI0024067814|nr:MULTISPECIES: hypothetical protein [unclassified Breznakia]MDF9838006.1 hypothetical protein [Breznakia sp. PFB2-8]MDF9859384.1 hypothetical protein [Breznakia sp. PH5-24]